MFVYDKVNKLGFKNTKAFLQQGISIYEAINFKQI